MALEGHSFEKRVERELSQSPYFYRRIKTRNSGFKNDNEIADFYVQVNGILIYLETKSTKEKRFPFSMAQTSQLSGLFKADTRHEDVTGGFLVEMRTFNEVYYVPIQVVEDYIKDRKVSINISGLRNSPKILKVDEDTDLKSVLEEISINKKESNNV